MFIRLAVFLCAISPRLRRLLWRWWYGRLAKDYGTDAWTFMNYGLVPADGGVLALPPEDEADRFCIQLYERVVSPADLTGRRVLEVGSGRGGGASYLARIHRPARVTGVDFSATAVTWCRRRHAPLANLEFLEGDAEALPFSDSTFDAVVNVESSHCYGDVRRFFREACRVLRPGGYFLYADVRPAPAMPELAHALAAETGWEPVAFEDLTAGVAAALVADDARKRRLIVDVVPVRKQRVFGEFAALAGTQMFEGFSSRTLLYHRLAYRKKADGR
jgi:SAM-dependent methyltransferase